MGLARSTTGQLKSVKSGTVHSGPGAVVTEAGPSQTTAYRPETFKV